MKERTTVTSWLWRVPVCMVVLVAGQMLGAALAAALGLELPAAPVPVAEGTQLLLLFAAALTVALALGALALGLAGRWWERWAVLAAFFYGVHGVGNAVEARIFTTLGGELGVAVMHLPAALLGALVVALLIAGPSEEGLRAGAARFLSRWRPAGLAARLALAVVAFPFFYLLFGMIIAPIVTPHYARLDFLVIPPMATILKVLFGRSALFLLVSLPLIIAWRESRRRLILALGFAHFVAVGLAGLIQTTFFPAVLRWTHGVEILADSICYAGALAWLLFPREEPAAGEAQELRRRLV